VLSSAPRDGRGPRRKLIVASSAKAEELCGMLNVCGAGRNVGGKTLSDSVDNRWLMQRARKFDMENLSAVGSAMFVERLRPHLVSWFDGTPQRENDCVVAVMVGGSSVHQQWGLPVALPTAGKLPAAFSGAIPPLEGGNHPAKLGCRKC